MLYKGWLKMQINCSERNVEGLNLDPITILHIPHSSTHIPREERGDIHLSDEALKVELLRMTDWYTDELFELPDNIAIPVVFPVSRLVVDPERFEDDAQETSSGWGMGVIYTKTSQGHRLRDTLTPQERRRLLASYYRPHHAQLAACVKNSLICHNKALVVDCHSFPSMPQPYEENQNAKRPDICIGTDDFHTPNWILKQLLEALEAEGFVCAINSPFCGALVPMDYYQTDKSVSSIMIEVNRGLYLDESSGQKGTHFIEVRNSLQKVVSNLIVAFGIRSSS
jgi:N-formylglutamate deformylase